MQNIDFTITQSSIDHGRLYFEAQHRSFFPEDAIGGRGATEHASGKVWIAAGADKVQADIRISSGTRISPRPSFKLWLRSVGAVAGASAKLHRVSEREYRLEYLG